MAKFKTRARAIDMLGRQQIAGIPTAISELFKNAHDAYAHFADVDYFRSDNIFVLRDDGIGMTEDDFLNRWLAIGTESKVGGTIGLEPPPKPEGEKDRPMLGEKGIGRLAIAAVGPQVLILTRAIRNDKQFDTVAAFINWGIFESPGLNLDEIEIPVIPYEKGALPSRGDVIALVDLFRENIIKLGNVMPLQLVSRINSELEQFNLDPRALDDFLNKIGKPTLTNGGHGTHFLILPTNESLLADINGEDNVNDGPAPPIIQRLIGFTNTMVAEREPPILTSFRDHKPLEPYVDLISPNSFFTPDEFQTADHHFSGDFDEFGQFNGVVTIYNKAPISHTIQWTQGKGVPTKCGPFKLDLAYVQGNPKESLLPPDKYVRITRKLNKIGGLYIYKDGIRVLPYGSSDYDFLDLEQNRSRKASYYFFSYRRMFGYVEITGKNNPELNEKAGREGFRENTAYRQFKAILKNFFVQMAADFFRESGAHSETFFEGRAELTRLDSVRRARELKVKEDRKQFARIMDDFFERVQAGMPQRESAHLIESVAMQIQEAFGSEDPMQVSTALMEIEANARQKIEELRNRYKVIKPRGVGLTTALRRDWELCASEAGRLEGEVFQPAQKSMEALITDASHQRASKVSPQRRIERALKDRIANAQKVIEEERNRTQQEIDRISNRVVQLSERSLDEVNSVIRQTRTELDRLRTSNKEEAYILGEYYRLEGAIAEVTQRESLTLDNLRRRLQESINSSLNADELIEALEEENLALRERSESDVELAQLGMAISVISHEFRSTVQSIRGNLDRLKGWGSVNKDLRELSRNIRSDFEHLDAYLELFTPLQQRLFRKKVKIKGSDIVRYLRSLFGERLSREKVELQVSNTFMQMSFDGYPSTFYPVFVNLIDNSLYWLKDRSGPRVIQLDMEGGSTFIISDNGPGIPKRDRDAIFERGFTRKPGGRGMGLKISRDVLAREGRDLVLADSKPGEGATFKIKLMPQEKRG